MKLCALFRSWSLDVGVQGDVKSGYVWFTRQLNKFWKLAAQSVVMKPVRPETHHSIDILPWPKRNMTSSSIMQRQYHIDLMCLQTHGDYLFYCIGFVLGSICTASKQFASIYQRNSSPSDSWWRKRTRVHTHNTNALLQSVTRKENKQPVI